MSGIFQATLEKFRDMLGEPRGGPGRVEGPFGRLGMGRGIRGDF